MTTGSSPSGSSRGVLPITILQSYRQGARVWGEAGMDAMWSASTVKVIGAGIDDAKLAEDLSRLIGDHDVTVRTVSHGRGGSSESSSLPRQRILAPEDARALPRGRALVLAPVPEPRWLSCSPGMSDLEGRMSRRRRATRQRN